MWGCRPRWGSEWIKNATLADLRQEAADLEKEVKREIELARQERAHQAAEKAAHHLAYAAAFKPVTATHKPFANLKNELEDYWSF